MAGFGLPWRSLLASDDALGQLIAQEIRAAVEHFQGHAIAVVPFDVVLDRVAIAAVNLDRLLRDLYPLVGVVRLGGRTSVFPLERIV